MIPALCSASWQELRCGPGTPQLLLEFLKPETMAAPELAESNDICFSGFYFLITLQREKQ